MRTWNKRATQGALIRLDQTGMIKRFRVRKKHSEDSWATCIEVLREPRDEDVSNLGFRRQATAMDESIDELLDEDVDGETLMRDLEVDMLDGADGHVNSSANTHHDLEKPSRIPPQWTPDRFLANMVFDVIVLGGVNGWDAETLRDRIIGPFWRRPMESYVTRLTDDWEKTQPPPIRHLAIIRDSRNTQEKKFIHYVYRTYENFQKAVDAGEVHWEAVSKPVPKENSTQQQGRSKRNATDNASLDAWGFHRINSRDFVRSDGSATLSEVRLAIVHPRKYGPRWDNALTQEIGYQKSETPVAKLKASRGPGKSVIQAQDDGHERRPRVMKLSKSKKKMPLLSLTPEQRISLGLKPNGRLSKSAEQQIFAHRATTGDPTSLPDRIEEMPTMRGQPPLMSAEERIAQGLPARGRLGIALENEIRAERGLAKLPKKSKKREKKTIKEPALLSKEQRLAFGWKGHGRLPQDLMDGLRQEREDGISLEDSSVLPKYMDMLKAKAATPTASELVLSVETEAIVVEQYQSPSVNMNDLDDVAQPAGQETRTQTLPLMAGAGKRKADIAVISPGNSKKQRMAPDTSLKESRAVESSRTQASPDVIVSQMSPFPETRSVSLIMTEEDTVRVATTTQNHGPTAPTPANNTTITGTGVYSLPAPTAKSNTEATLRPSPLLQPNIDTLNSQAQSLYSIYTSRSTPGLYLNPFARHKVARGRPRKAFIATFKLPRLKEHEWFQDIGDDVRKSPRNMPTETSIASPKGNTQRTEDDVTRPTTIPNSLLLPSTTSNSITQAHTHHLSAISTDNDSEDPSALVEKDSLPQNSNEASKTQDHFAEAQVEHTVDSVVHNPESQVPLTAPVDITEQSQEVSAFDQQNQSHFTKIGQVPNAIQEHAPQLESKALASDIVSEHPIEQASQGPVSESRAAIAWTAINASVQPRPSQYQSPYAPVICSDSTPPLESTDNATVADVPMASDSLPKPSMVGEDSNSPLPQGMHSAISEVQAPLPPEPRPRSKKHVNTEGSALLFRRNIIREIIDLCNGVFPDGGEIGRPFHTLWTQRHGHIKGLKEPIASTVNSTMRNMCNHPKFGLKRMTFLVKNKNGPFNSKKEIITYAHLTPRSPEVLKLAYNIANFSHEKSHQYFPEGIRHLIDDTSLYYPLPVPPKDDSIVLNQVNPELEAHIKEAQKRYRNEMARQKRLEKKARKAQNAQVEEAPTRKSVEGNDGPRVKRARLASLNDKNKRYRRVAVQQGTPEVIGKESEEYDTGDLSSAETESSDDSPLIWTRPLIAPPTHQDVIDENEQESTPRLDGLGTERSQSPSEMTGVLSDVVEKILPSAQATEEPQPDQVLSDQIDTTKSSDEDAGERSEHSVKSMIVAPRRKKRVRITDAIDRPPKKKSRPSTVEVAPIRDDDYIQISSAESNAAYSEADLEDEKNSTLQSKKTTKKRRNAGKRQRGKHGPLPTLLERLTGLTGDPNDPIYQQPLRQQRGRGRIWAMSEKQKAQVNKKKKDRKYIEILDPVDKFKKLFCTLVIASSMSEGDKIVDWTIVEKVYSSDKSFDNARTKDLWAWMQDNMATQLADLTTAFQSAFIEAYENGKVPAIEDPGAYDWAGLVRWVMRKCPYPELPRPLYLEALHKFTVDESNYEALDRSRWYKEKIADRVRTQLQLHHSFTAPLHHSRHSDWSRNDKVLKARSWVRANTATSQALYNGIQAHEKLMVLGESLFVRVVGDYVDKQILRMRKLKRLLPGRNYSFTKAFAKKFVRPFELNDFMDAVKVKKDMDAAFADVDPQKRFFSISRSEEDAPVAAIMNLVSEGRIRLVPQLPPVNNEFGAPLPRLSLWGFCEGDYIHRAIDRNRLFWDIHVVPTADYQFGSPLQPTSRPPLPNDDSISIPWPRLPDPPLPGKDDASALLPIWSSIDGQSITWPWWYRILNLVLQPLIFQPGATAKDILSHCPEHTTELFEIELVLDWLESVGAVSKTASRSYVTLPGFWAAFGDNLLDTEGDWFGEHVKRKTKNHEKQRWREEYNLRHSKLQTRSSLGADADTAEGGGEAEIRDLGIAKSTAIQQILENPKRQYRIMQQALDPHKEQGDDESSTAAALPSPAVHGGPIESPLVMEELRALESTTAEATDTQSQDAAIVTTEAHGVDVDAEGEVDDAMY